MRKLVLAAVMTAVALTPACSSFMPATHSQRVVILGLDGLDPDLAREWMQEKRLPNLARLAALGGFYRLQTIPSPDCETAWSVFATGRSVNKPVVTHEPARLLLNFVPLESERWRTTREGTTFWTTAGRHNVRASVLNVPGTFPPETIPGGELLSGLPLPDVRRSRGTYQFFGTNVAAHEEGETKNGGRLRRLTFDRQRVAQAVLVGPLHPVSRDELGVPMNITWNYEARSANIELGPHAVHLREREWSRWLELDFPVNAITRVRGITQLFLIRAGTELALYVSPVQWHPNAPSSPISSPPQFARDLYQRLGLFRTWGWNAATGALNDERIDEAAFLDDIDWAFQDRAETILNRMDAAEWDVLIGVVDTPDRVQHMMWRLIDTQHPRYDSELARRYGASIEQAYQQADELLGQILSRVSANTIVMVLSDHGFHTVRSEQKWSGDHTAANLDDVAGVLVSNVKLNTETPRLMDVAPTVLKVFGVTGADIRGVPLF